MTYPAQQPPQGSAPQGSPAHAQPTPGDPAQQPVTAQQPDATPQSGSAQPEGRPQEPPSAEEQINNTIDYQNSPIDEILRSLSIFTPWNQPQDTPSGGGGAGGKYIFTDPAELRTIIGKWEEKAQTIGDYGRQIRQAIWDIEPLAQDDASNGMAKKTRESLTSMAKHNEAMQKYAHGYIKKLRSALADIEQNEQDSAAAANQTHQG